MRRLKKLNESIGAFGINLDELTLDKKNELKFVDRIMKQIYEAEVALSGKDGKKLEQKVLDTVNKEHKSYEQV